MTAWMQDASCRHTDPEAFFPNHALREAVEPALKVCRACPVQAECLAHAKRIGATHGIWGGTLLGRPRIGAEEEQELLEGVRTGLDSGWSIEETAKHLRINLQRAKKYQRIIESAQKEEEESWAEQGKVGLVGRVRRMLPF